MSQLRASDGNARLTLPTGECKVCSGQFIKLNSMQMVCGVKCAIKLPVIARNSLKAKAKADRASTKARKEAIKTRSDWLKEAQREFNSYIRARDAELACISCGRNHQGQWHAGHYLSVGARPELRFDDDNVHKQCQPCNTHLHGNLVLYRVALAARIGDARLARLEGPHAPKHYTTDELKAMAIDFRARVRSINKERE